MKKLIYIILSIIICLPLTGCKKTDEKKLKENIEAIEWTGDLITNKTFCHNVATYEKKKEEGLFHIFDKDRKLWIEYTGVADLGINLNKLKVIVIANNITVIIPKTEIINTTVEINDFDNESFYDSDGGIFNRNELTIEDSTKAMSIAQDEMKKSIKNDANVLKIAQLRSKDLIEKRIQQFSKMSDSKYNIKWQYEKN